MKRWVQGLSIVLGSIAGSVAALAAALAWGPHQCEIAFPMVIGCAMGSYENLAGGLFPASAAIFAGWLAWSAVQVQISAEERRAAADRVEIENVLQADFDYMAEALATIWKIFDEILESPPSAEVLTVRLEGVNYGIERLTSDIGTMRDMVTALGWKRRRTYERWLHWLERLGEFQDVNNFEAHEALNVVKAISNHFEMLRPETARYFEGFWRRSGKAWDLAYSILMMARREGSCSSRSGGYCTKKSKGLKSIPIFRTRLILAIV
ncbi:hypothetical protein QCM80_18215 [Bradyrhizobium sp. SSUT112]|uniref:hypothetical protein n=1 Tax=Bradyrhizobium sp. SSUT112 TaxID=3040604 RepID=UPI0024468232|nr:hypothetical protein [Bradyrhizobium sp. SSUT112]MDH2352572.1 hypothetical protein [Bradyrhizobium sp. SSUT112]